MAGSGDLSLETECRLSLCGRSGSCQGLTINGFIYRERGVLIGYVLCSRCATKIFEASRRAPGRPTARHATIEANLRKAYDKYMASLDA